MWVEVLVKLIITIFFAAGISAAVCVGLEYDAAAKVLGLVTVVLGTLMFSVIFLCMVWFD